MYLSPNGIVLLRKIQHRNFFQARGSQLVAYNGGTSSRNKTAICNIHVLRGRDYLVQP